MARTPLTVHKSPNPYLDAGLSNTPDAADVSQGNVFTATGRDLVIIYNSDISSHTMVVRSTPDYLGRTGDKTITVGAGQIAVTGILAQAGWLQSNGKISLDTDDASLLLLVLAV